MRDVMHQLSLLFHHCAEAARHMVKATPELVQFIVDPMLRLGEARFQVSLRRLLKSLLQGHQRSRKNPC